MLVSLSELDILPLGYTDKVINLKYIVAIESIDPIGDKAASVITLIKSTYIGNSVKVLGTPREVKDKINECLNQLDTIAQDT